MSDGDLIVVVFDRHPYTPDDEGNCWECGEDYPPHERGQR